MRKTNVIYMRKNVAVKNKKISASSRETPVTEKAPCKKVDGSFTVEASFIMVMTILVIFSIIVIAMSLSGHAKATSTVRLSIEKRCSDVMTGQSDQLKFAASKTQHEIGVWPDASVSYTEHASRTFVKATTILYGKKLLEME